MDTNRYHVLRTVHPRWRIDLIARQQDGSWIVKVFDSAKFKDLVITVKYNDFADWLADTIWPGLADNRIAAEKYIIERPHDTEAYLKDHIFSKL